MERNISNIYFENVIGDKSRMVMMIEQILTLNPDIGQVYQKTDTSARNKWHQTSPQPQ
jgi:hypothetical protein